MTKYLGSKDKVIAFVKECRDVGLDIGNPEIIRNIAQKPEWFQVIISYSELGLLKRMGNAIETIKGNRNDTY